MDHKPLNNLLTAARDALRIIERSRALAISTIDRDDPAWQALRVAVEDVDKLVRVTRDRLDLRGDSRIPLDDLIRAEQEADIESDKDLAAAVLRDRKEAGNVD